MTFQTEAEFEEAVVQALISTKGWSSDVLKYPTEEDLIENWKKILFLNNNTIDRLNGCPLTDGEMGQILEQITALKTPVKLNGFINGYTVAVKRDNPDDTLHLGKEVSLKIYDRHEIAAGQSTYQIAQQPKFKSKSKILGDRRGDVMLLINGMPVIHIELKRSGVHVSQAATQIEKYSREGIFTGLFSLVQIFVAMTPEETLYFANPGVDGIFNKDFYFHWANFNNEVINDWKVITEKLLSIPMAHEMIGFYTIADESDGILKVLRSYQYYAVNKITDRVNTHKWGESSPLGGYIAHTTGSGKTLTSFKAAQLISESKKADKVLFLVDRIELGTQSLREYQHFARKNETVQETEDTQVLVSKLKDHNPSNTLIVTSIQKMSRLSEEEGFDKNLLEELNKKKIVIIVDEAHRSTFGDMRRKIREAFPNALFFGFTGTPILEENQKLLTTADIFGDELHNYCIADGIRDKNVLGFDLYQILTYKDNDLRTAVALEKAKATTVEEAVSDPVKSKKFYYYMDKTKVPMAGYEDSTGEYVKGIEDYLPNTQYIREEHQKQVVSDILEKWVQYSHGSKFHAIFATSSIKEALDYYHLFKEENSGLKIAALFDPSIDNSGGFELKQDGLVELLEDYNNTFGTSFNLANFKGYKKDVSYRLAHKEQYKFITKEEQMDLLIVVDQMLTGFDSKWVNTIYLDKVLRYEHIIQAFSRTNRIFGPDKPFGIVRYYRKPHTMQKYIETAVKLYSGENAYQLFVDKLRDNLLTLNRIFEDIKSLFETAGVSNFSELPDEFTAKRKFAQLFRDLNIKLEAAKLQGFSWKELIYNFTEGEPKEIIVLLDETTYNALVQRYKELFNSPGGSGEPADVPFEVEGYLTEIDTGVIDAEYMNTNFEKFCKSLDQPNVTEEERQALLDELHKSFATLTQDEQRHASLILHSVQSGDLKLESGKTFRDYITQYMARESRDRISRFASLFGLDEALLREMTINKTTSNEFGRFDKLMSSLDTEKAGAYLSALEGKEIKGLQVKIKARKILTEFLSRGGYDIEIPEGWEI